MPWRIVDLTIEGNSFIARLTDGRNEIELSADLLFLGRKTAILKGLHVQGLGANTVGVCAGVLGTLGESGTRCRSTPNCGRD